MASGITDYGRQLMLLALFRQETFSEFYVAFITDAVVPDEATEDFSSLTQIATGNGYADGGYAVDADDVGFPTLSVVDSRQVIEVMGLDVEASGGDIPDSGDPASYAVLLTNEATPSDRKVVAYWELSAPMTVTDGNTTGMEDLALRLGEEA